MITLTYTYYKNEYYGDLPESAFNKQTKKAFAYLYANTNSSIKKVTDDSDPDLVDAIRTCLCMLIDKLDYYSSTNDKIVSSQKSGKVSETYAVSKTKTSLNAELGDIIKLLLGDYGYTQMIWI